MERVKLTFAVVILAVWVAVVGAAIVNKDLIALATIVTPVMLLPAGWLFTDQYLRAKKEQREPGRDQTS